MNQVANQIVAKQILAPSIKRIELLAPEIAKKSKAGQFVILRIDETAERIPLTLVDWDAQKGTITLIFQEVGLTTRRLGQLEVGEYISDLVGPLGNPSEIGLFGKVMCVGGGVGVVSLYPIIKELKTAGNFIITVVGARDKVLLVLEDEIKTLSDQFYVITDNGSYGRKGFVSDVVSELLTKGELPDRVIAMGPAVMMQVISELTRPYNIKTIVSLNPIMVDGTGMCGGCRVTVGGKTRFTCVHGPEFDGHEVDFKELLARQRIYLEEEKECLAKVG